MAEALGTVDVAAVSRMAGALLRRDGAALLAEIAALHERGLEMKRVAEELARHLRNVVVARLAPGAPLDLPDAELDEVRAQARDADPAQLTRLFDLAQRAVVEVKLADQPRHALEVALLKAVFLAPGADVSALIARVEALAGGALPPAVRRAGRRCGPGGPAAPALARRAAARAVAASPASAARAPCHGSPPPRSGRRAPSPVPRSAAPARRPAPTAAPLVDPAAPAGGALARRGGRGREGEPGGRPGAQAGHAPLDPRRRGRPAAPARADGHHRRAAPRRDRGGLRPLLRPAHPAGAHARRGPGRRLPGESAPVSLAAAEQAERLARSRQVREAARAHPNIQQAARLLEGGVDEIEEL